MSSSDYEMTDSDYGVPSIPDKASDTESSLSDDVQTGVSMTSVRVATQTCLHKYAIARMEGAQDETIPWPPLMLVVISYLNRHYDRRELVTERNIAMLELLLKVPIQLLIKRSDGNVLDLNNDTSLDYSGMAFPQSLEILRDLISKGVVSMSDIRVSEEELRRF